VPLHYTHTHARTHTHMHHQLWSCPIYLSLTSLLSGVFQNQLVYLRRRGVPILGRPLPALKPRNVCQQGVGQGGVGVGPQQHQVTCVLQGIYIQYIADIKCTFYIGTACLCGWLVMHIHMTHWTLLHGIHTACYVHVTSSHGDQRALIQPQLKLKYNTIS